MDTSKGSQYQFRITHDEKKRWKEFAEEKFDGQLSKLIRAAVTNYINDVNMIERETHVIEKLDDMRMEIDNLFTWIKNNYSYGLESTTIELDPSIQDQDIPDLEFQKVDKKRGSYDF